MKGKHLIPYVAVLGSVSAIAMWSTGTAAETAGAKTAKPEAAKASDVAKSDAPSDDDGALSAEEARRALPAAKVDGAVITLGEMEDALAAQPPMFRREYASLEKQKELLDRLVKSKLLAREAARRGFGDDSEVKAVTKNKLASLMHKKLVESADSLKPSEEELKKYYDEHQSDYHKPEKMRARQILIKDKARAEAKLKELLEKKVELHKFRKLAKEITEDEAGKKKGGDLGFFTKPADRKEGAPELPAALVEAVFTLKKNGDIYPKLIGTEDGFHILMRTGYRNKLDISFEEARERIEVLVMRNIRREAIEAGIEKLKEKSPVEVSEENLKHVVIDLSKDTAREKNPG